VHQVGEVAAYTPQSINDKWYDETSNANHGTITGATSVGDNDYRGILTVKGRSDFDPRDLNDSGMMLLGDIAAYQGRIDYSAKASTTLTIDNSYNSATAKTSFGMRTASTRLPVLELLGDGAVKATSTTDDSLRQVARLVTFKIQPPASNTAVCFQYTHGLSTDHTHVTVMQDTTAPYGVVECDVRRGKHTTGTTAAGGGVTSGADNGYQSGGADNISILFSSAPANGTDYLVTIVG
jgi:hypothetical protein